MASSSDYQFQAHHRPWSYPNQDTDTVLVMSGQSVGLEIQEPFQMMVNRSYPITQERYQLQDEGPIFVAPGQVDFSYQTSGFSELIKLERQRREREAGVWLDSAAQKLLSALDRETSIRWEDIPDMAECDWSEATRAAALLAGANLCEVSPTRIRLSEYGVKLLAESSLTEQTSHEVAI